MLFYIILFIYLFLCFNNQIRQKSYQFQNFLQGFSSLLRVYIKCIRSEFVVNWTTCFTFYLFIYFRTTCQDFPLYSEYILILKFEVNWTTGFLRHNICLYITVFVYLFIYLDVSQYMFHYILIKQHWQKDLLCQGLEILTFTHFSWSIKTA